MTEYVQKKKKKQYLPGGKMLPKKKPKLEPMKKHADEEVGVLQNTVFRATVVVCCHSMKDPL